MFRVKTLFVSVFLLLFTLQFIFVDSVSTTDPNISISNNRTKRAVSIIPDFLLWRGGVVPYVLSPELASQKCLIETAMLHMMLQTCIYFRPRQAGDFFSLRIHQGQGCHATALGQTVFTQISLGRGCHLFGIVQHELMHALGFTHEHSRSDRDQYLKVNYHNMQNSFGLRHQFRQNARLLERAFTEFDFDSVMMYEDTAGSVHWSRPTIESRVPGRRITRSYSNGLSPLDVKSINALYKCHTVKNKACEKLEMLKRVKASCGFQVNWRMRGWTFVDKVERECANSRI